MKAMKRTLATTAVILAALLLSGCTTSGSQSSGAYSGAPGVEQNGGIVGVPVPAAPGQEVADGSASDSSGVVKSDNRDVITTGGVSITVKDPVKSAQYAVAITEKAGGRIDSRTETPATDNQPASAMLQLRIPADALDRTLAELKKLGTVNHLSLTASDVTQQTRDLDARITSLKTSVDRLLSLMSKASNTADLIAIESALSDRQSQLESLQSQREYLSDQIDYSTLSLELYEVGVVPPGSPDNFWTAIVAGWNALIATIGGALIAFGYVLPWLIVLAVIGIIVLLIIWSSTRRRTRVPAAAGPTPPPAEPVAPVQPGTPAQPAQPAQPSASEQQAAPGQPGSPE